MEEMQRIVFLPHLEMWKRNAKEQEEPESGGEKENQTTPAFNQSGEEPAPQEAASREKKEGHASHAECLADLKTDDKIVEYIKTHCNEFTSPNCPALFGYNLLV
jgi:hypothetical protein